MAINGKITMAYFISTVRYDKMQENGTVKRVNEHYLVDAISVSEAEAHTAEYITPFISGEFSIPTVKRAKIAEVFKADCDYFWLVKVAFITIDEKTGQQKKSISQILVQADDFGDACEAFGKGMKGTLADFEIQSVSLSNIIDYIPFKAK